MSSVQQYKDLNKRLKAVIRKQDILIDKLKTENRGLKFTLGVEKNVNESLKKLLNHYEVVHKWRTWWLKNIRRKNFEV